MPHCVSVNVTGAPLPIVDIGLHSCYNANLFCVHSVRGDIDAVTAFSFSRAAVVRINFVCHIGDCITFYRYAVPLVDNRCAVSRAPRKLKQTSDMLRARARRFILRLKRFATWAFSTAIAGTLSGALFLRVVFGAMQWCGALRAVAQPTWVVAPAPPFG